MVDGQTTDDNGRRRTDDRACLYYKLTNEPKGSGELKRRNKPLPSRLIFPVQKCIIIGIGSELYMYKAWIECYRWPGYDIEKQSRHKYFLCQGFSNKGINRPDYM